MLTVRELRVTYARSIVGLRSASLEVAPGAVVAVLGSNGAGKTTLLRAVSGTLPDVSGRISSGSITFEGQSLVGRPAHAIVDARIVQAPEGRRVFERLTVAENLRIGAFRVRDSAGRRRTLQQVLELFPVLGERRDQRAGLLSGGQQQMLAIGRALMAQPRLLLLDEPSLGLAPQMVSQVAAAIRRISESGTAIVVVEQNAAMALSLASYAYVLSTGEVSLSGPAGDLARDDRVRDLYLGRTDSPAPAGDLPRLARWSG